VKELYYKIRSAQVRSALSRNSVLPAHLRAYPRIEYTIPAFAFLAVEVGPQLQTPEGGTTTVKKQFAQDRYVTACTSQTVTPHRETGAQGSV